MVSCFAFSVWMPATGWPSRRAEPDGHVERVGSGPQVGFSPHLERDGLRAAQRLGGGVGASAIVVDGDHRLGQAAGRGVEVERRDGGDCRCYGTQDERDRKSEPRQTIEHARGIPDECGVALAGVRSARHGALPGYEGCMNDDRETQDPDDAALDADAPTDGGKGDQYDEGVVAADDTGMLGGEQLITQMEIERGLRGE